jgi:hypothetical protein
MENIIAKITAVINTLNGATIRADQIDAIQRINVCVNELRNVIAECAMEQRKQEEQPEEQPEEKEE